jgi:hypothetical protein
LNVVKKYFSYLKHLLNASTKIQKTLSDCVNTWDVF